jgi:hypothetical protein
MCQTSKYRSLAILPTEMVFDQKLVIFPIATHSGLAVMQSRVHEAWALFLGSSLEDRPVYTPTDCFETFPFPLGWEYDASLVEIGREYYEYRASLMAQHNWGLTATYNHFHSPYETSIEIWKLRQLHASMDRAVLAAYSWQNISTDCDFFVDHEENPEEADTPAERGNKPWRYRWPDEVRDEVLARLLELNAKRAEEEKLAGLAAAAARPAGMKRARKAKSLECPKLEL